MKNKLMKTVSKAKIMVMAAWLYIMVPLQLWANQGTGEPKIVSGTKALINDVQGILLGIAVAVATILELWTWFKYMTASEDQKPQYIKNAKTILITVILILTGVELLLWIVGHYM